MKHVAYNLATGEVVICSRACALRRRVAKITRWDVANGYRGHHWVFAHGKDAMNTLGEKYFGKA